MSLVLRHKPDEIGVTMDSEGWVKVDELIDKMIERGINVDTITIEEIVATNDKKRFAFNHDKTLIRASQGHSIEVELNLPATTPPDTLYHGTATRNVEAILKTGIQKQHRQHVHLSVTIETARAVGSRHGKPVILLVDARAMHESGIKFYLSANKVWLTDSIPVEFISKCQE